MNGLVTLVGMVPSVAWYIILAAVIAMWTIKIWKAEYDRVKVAWTTNAPVKEKFNSVFCFAGDIIITTSAVGIFGLRGMWAAPVAWLVSNFISRTFFMPKKGVQPC